MEHLVVTAVGDDRAGLVETLAGVIARHGGNWEQSQMAELAGKFAGVVVVSVSGASVAALRAELDKIESGGLLNIIVQTGDSPQDSSADSRQISLDLVGQDHPGIVHEISHALAELSISIEELGTEIVPAPMGGHLFQAKANLNVPNSVSIDDLQDALEAVAQDLMVDLDLTTEL